MSSRFAFEGIGTSWIIDIYDESSDILEADLFKKIQDCIEGFDKKYSRFRNDSFIIEMSRTPGKYILPPDSKPMFDLYQKLYDLTGGLVTPLIGNLLSDAGYDAVYTLEEKELSPAPLWEDTLLYKFPDLLIRKPVILDLGACGKGYLIDIVGELLEKENIQDYCIDAGGDIRQRTTNSTPVRVGLEHPDDSTQAIGVINLENKSLCGSAGNRRAWGRFHHIMNPKTMEPEGKIKAVWVIADTTLLADGLSTALFFTDPEKLADVFDFDYLLVFPDMSIKKSESFPGELFFN